MLSSKKAIQGLGLLAVTGVIGFSAMKVIAHANISPDAIASSTANTIGRPAEKFNIAFRLVDIDSQINVRSGPGTDFQVKHYGLGGDSVTALNQSAGNDGYEWFYVVFDQSLAQGWIREDLLIQDKSYEVSLGGLNPEFDDALYEKELHQDVHIESDAQLLEHIRSHDLVINQGYAQLQAPDPLAQINIRKGPGTINPIQHVGYTGDSVEVFDIAFSQDQDEHFWYYVRFSQSGAEGWVREDLIIAS